MPSLHNFYRKFDSLTKEDKFNMIHTPVEPTSLFVIFKQLTDVRAQIRYFEKREAHLLSLADVGFDQLNKLKE